MFRKNLIHKLEIRNLLEMYKPEAIQFKESYMITGLY